MVNLLWYFTVNHSLNGGAIILQKKRLVMPSLITLYIASAIDRSRVTEMSNVSMQNSSLSLTLRVQGPVSQRFVRATNSLAL